MFILYRLANGLRRSLFRLAVGPFFGRLGKGSNMVRPRGIEGISRIFIDDAVYIAEGGLLAAIPHTGYAECRLTIGQGCKLGAFNHIYATRAVVLEEKVLTAGNVYIADNSHGFADAARAIMDQPVEQLPSVRIGAGSWLGQNVCVIGASIGRGCVIGAGSVVTSDIPDHCVAVGAPARVVRRYDPASDSWMRVASTSAADTAKG